MVKISERKAFSDLSMSKSGRQHWFSMSTESFEIRLDVSDHFCTRAISARCEAVAGNNDISCSCKFKMTCWRSVPRRNVFGNMASKFSAVKALLHDGHLGCEAHDTAHSLAHWKHAATEQYGHTIGLFSDAVKASMHMLQDPPGPAPAAAMSSVSIAQFLLRFHEDPHQASNSKSKVSMADPSEFDCPICKTDLGSIKAFVAPTFDAEDQEVSAEVFRLRCGHAYHNGCLCRALRSQAGCPTCRQAPTSASAYDNWTLTIDESGVAVMRLSAEEPADGWPQGAEAAYELPVDELPRVHALMDALDAVRATQPIQQLRRHVNSERRKYKALETELTNARATKMRDAARQFRAARHAEYKAARSAYARALKRLKKAELAQLAKIDQSFRDDADRFAGDQWDIEPRLAYFGPHKRKFWGPA